MFDVRRLRALREVADRGTIAAAADALHLTPSAVSQQLTALAREVGHPVVERDGRRVRLTPAATVLLEHADTLLAQVERLRADLDAQHRGAVGEVRVAAFATAISGLVAPAVPVLRDEAPGVRLAVREAEAPEALLGLTAGDVDVVVTMEGGGAPAHGDRRFARVDLLRDVMDLALPAGHPLADADELELADLADEQWVLPPVGWRCDEVATGACRAAGFSPRAAHRTGDWTSALALVAAGLGVALIPRLARRRSDPAVRLIPLSWPPPCRHVFAVCRRGAEARPAVGETLAALRAVAAAAGEAAEAAGAAR